MRKKKLKRVWIKRVFLLSLIFILFLFTFENDFISGVFKDIFYAPFTLIDSANYDVISNGINEELLKERDDLLDLLKMDSTLVDFNTIGAVVVERNSGYWQEILTINKGSKDGVKKGMAVISSGGLVGSIYECSLLTSVVKLISRCEDDNKISVSILNDEGSIYNVLLTDSEYNKVIMGIKNTDKIKVGDKVYTTGLSDIYPNGILVGEISKIVMDNYGISQKAYVKLASRLDDLRFVVVLDRKIDNE